MAEFEKVVTAEDKIDALLQTLQGAAYRVDGGLTVLTANCSNCAFLKELRMCPFEFQNAGCRENFSPLFGNNDDEHGRGDFLTKLKELIRHA